jgi:tRNA-binding protein
MSMTHSELAPWSHFSSLDIRVGQIVDAQVFPEAKKPAYQLLIDFGSMGIKKSSAQLTLDYTPDELIGKQIVAIINFPPKQIAHVKSECLVLGVVSGPNVRLLIPDIKVENGLKIG